MADTFQVVLPSYLETHRYYHNIDHVIDLLVRAQKYGDRKQVLDEAGNLVQPLYDAILFHDAIYDVFPQSSKSNEWWSADAYRQYVEYFRDGRTFAEIDHVVSMILATETHFDLNINYEDYFTNLLLDIDVLGFATEDFEKFLKYQADIDMEYLTVYPHDYVVRRRLDFLENIYQKKLLRYRVIDPEGVLTKMAYSNLHHYLSNYSMYSKVSDA